ncbi:hypothetical protein SETIT_3G074900v2 [Setaria italica]|uniref:RING-type E3 ubiquitin transferase n=2 Tax=Setaria TaxID=4554 RepID=K3ZCA4_SETIT|nr:probable E3 ubiquitin-protein ligase ATL44 [Setaria italica]RCV15660.1 hypothetical protein SETIT_3G074900v2 [Setaria italica]TKW24839.1 hypothetical protein SEVIR_3G076400v2 [Setaria viridis]
MPSRQPPSSSSLPLPSSSSPSSPGVPAPDAAAGCLPADQSCFAVSVSVGAPSYTSRHDAAAATASAHACCTTTSYIAVLGISFGSLLAILLILCAIRWYLVRRSESRDAAEAAAAAAAEPDKKRSTGLDADAIAALPEFAYRKEAAAAAAGDEAEERECAVCLGALAEGEAARLLPLCMHVFHRGCVDVWLRERSTCPVCRAEVVARCAGEGCADKEQEGGTSRGSTSTAAALPPQGRLLDDGERDLEAQL